MEINFSNLVDDVFEAVRGITTTGFDKIRTLIAADVRDLAMRAKILTQLRLSGEIDEAEFIKEVDRGQRLVKSIGMTIAALAAITLEKVWNAVVNVVWGAINGVLRAAGLGSLALPGAPNP